MKTKYTDKIHKMYQHLQNNPHDYQTVISFLKLNSKNYDEERKLIMNENRKLLAKYKKEGWTHGE